MPDTPNLKSYSIGLHQKLYVESIAPQFDSKSNLMEIQNSLC